MNKINITGANETCYKEILPNGFKIYVIPGETNGITMNLTVNYGSAINDFRFKGEEEYKHLHLGVAHFLEHLTFKMPDTDASDYFASLGSDSNAFTSTDQTTYEVWTTSNMEENLSYLIKYVLTPYYTEELVEKEKGIILEEAKRNLDNVRRKTNYKINENLFINDNRQYPIVGTLEEIESITLEDIENAYNYFYKPYNMILTVVGGVDPEKVVEVTKNALAEFNFDEVKEIELKSINEPANIKDRRSLVTDKNETPLFYVNYKIPVSEFKNLTKKETDIALYLLGTSCLSRTSDFYNYLKKNQYIIGNLGFYWLFCDDYLVFTLTAESNKYDEAIKEIEDKMKNLEIIEEDIERKKRAAIAQNILVFDNVNDYARGFTHEFQTFDEDVFNEVDIFKSITIDQIKTIKEVFANADKIVEVVTKKESK